GAVNGIDFVKMIHIANKNGTFYHLVEIHFGLIENSLDIAHYPMRFYFQVCRFEFSAFGVKCNLPRNIKCVSAEHCLLIRANWCRRSRSGYNCISCHDLKKLGAE